jgi:predicted nucleic acid-binding protein
MSVSAFFDTNVLIYLVTKQDSKSAVAEALIVEGGMVSVQVLNEFVSVGRRKLGMTWDEITEALAAIRELCLPVPVTIETHESALRIAADYNLNVYDALIAAAALQAGCGILYSEDLQADQLLEGRLTIRNPFR